MNRKIFFLGITQLCVDASVSHWSVVWGMKVRELFPAGLVCRTGSHLYILILWSYPRYDVNRCRVDRPCAMWNHEFFKTLTLIYATLFPGFDSLSAYHDTQRQIYSGVECHQWTGTRTVYKRDRSVIIITSRIPSNIPSIAVWIIHVSSR